MVQHIRLVMRLFPFVFCGMAVSSMAIPLGQLGTEADKQASSQGVEMTAEGLRLCARMQKLEVYVAPQGATIRSVSESEGKGDFSINPVALGRSTRSKSVPVIGTVSSQDEHSVMLDRNVVVEQFTASSEGIRQDFIITKRPAGKGELSLDLAVKGAKAATNGSGITITIPGGRKFVYGNLKVTDAKGESLVAKMAVINGNAVKIRVEDTGAHYPIVIDPTITDADWEAVNTGGIAGTDGNAGIRNFVLYKNNLYISGYFQTAGNVFANNIVKWDGSNWSALGTGIDYIKSNVVPICGLACDSSGNLYCGGYFESAGGNRVNCISKWDGNSWSALGTGMKLANGRSVNGLVHVSALACDNKGNLFAGGLFDSAGGIPARSIAKWDGNKWSELGEGISGSVSGIACDTLGNIYARVQLSYNSLDSQYITRWDGRVWNQLCPNTSGAYYPIVCDKEGTVYVNQFRCVQRWYRNVWDTLFKTQPDQTILALACDDNGNVFIGGQFDSSWTDSSGSIRLEVMGYAAAWDGNRLKTMGAKMNDSPVYSIVNCGNGKLFAGGCFTMCNDVEMDYVAGWNENNWSKVGSGMNFNSSVKAMAGDGKGHLYMGGYFTTIGNYSVARHVAQWDGSNWDTLGSGMNGEVYALVVNGKYLYAGGVFTSAGGVEAKYIARWDGTKWGPVGSGMNQPVFAMVCDTRGNLFAGGKFDTASGIRVNHVAKWDGNKWDSLGPGVYAVTDAGANGNVSGQCAESCVTSLAFDSSNNLYTGGWFAINVRGSANFINRWNGTRWDSIGAISGKFNHGVCALVCDRAGNLYAGANFSLLVEDLPNLSVRCCFSKWNGSVWAGFGSKEPTVVLGSYVYALMCDGGGNVYAGGSFDSISGVKVKGVGKWDGEKWNAIGAEAGKGGCIYSLAISDSTMFVGGNYYSCSTKMSPFISKVNIHNSGAAVDPVSKLCVPRTVCYHLVNNSLFLSNIKQLDHIFLFSLSGRIVHEDEGVSKINLRGIAPQPLFIRIQRAGKIISTGMVMMK